MENENPTPRERRRKLAAIFTKKVGIKEARRIKGKRQKDEGLWFGLSVFGIVGWSVVIPTLAGTAVGLWIYGHWPSRYSWTLMLLVLGAVLGCLNACYWVKKAHEKIVRD